MSEYDLGTFTSVGQYLTQLGPKGQLVTGPLKTAQRWSSAFLTEQGSVLYNPDYGTEFLYYLRFGMIRTEVDVAIHFNVAASQALDYVNAVENENNILPDDESIDTVALDHFELAPPNLMLYVIITMRSGDSVKITLPVTVAEEVTDVD